jgi:hypothetical protein
MEVQEPLQPESKSKKIFRVIRKIVLWFSGLFLLLVTTAALLAYVYSDKIIALAVAEMNRYLNAQVFIKPENISFSIIEHFPNAGIAFKDVKMMDATTEKKKGVLLFAGKVAFQLKKLNLKTPMLICVKTLKETIIIIFGKAVTIPLPVNFHLN